MDDARIVEENGSFRLIECGGRYAVVEMRDGTVYGLHAAPAPDDGAGRPEAPDTPARMADVVPSSDWMDEAQARGRFDEVVARGDGLARRIW